MAFSHSVHDTLPLPQTDQWKNWKVWYWEDAIRASAPRFDHCHAALQVFEHHKAHAALELTDTVAVDHCKGLAPLSVLRQFEGLYRMRQFHLLGRHEDVTGLLTSRVQQLLQKNLDVLLQRHQASQQSAVLLIRSAARYFEQLETGLDRCCWHL